MTKKVLQEEVTRARNIVLGLSEALLKMHYLYGHCTESADWKSTCGMSKEDYDKHMEKMDVAMDRLTDSLKNDLHLEFNTEHLKLLPDAEYLEKLIVKNRHN